MMKRCFFVKTESRKQKTATLRNTKKRAIKSLLLLHFLARVVFLNSLGLNDDVGVVPLDVTAFGRHRPGDVAAT